MRGKAPTGKGGCRSWTHVRVKGGDRFEAWIAGDPVCIDSHHISSTKPCLKSYLGSSVDCPGCSHPSRIEEQIAVPLYRCSDGRPVFVWCHDDMFDTLTLCKLHEQVVIGRTEERRSGIFVQRKLSQVTYQTTLDERKVTADITPYLPVVFGLVGIITPEMLRRGPLTPAPAPAPAPALPARGKRMTEDEERAELAKRVANRFTHEGKPIDGVLSSYLGSIGQGGESSEKVKRNGKH
jgi:hypothetical protein